MKFIKSSKSLHQRLKLCWKVCLSSDEMKKELCFMHLESIDIKNFRSIKNVTLSPEYNCTVLVGKNEAGKSNILKAIAGCVNSDAYKISLKDKRKKAPKENINKDEYFIRYCFSLSNEELEEFYNKFSNELFDNLFEVNDKPIIIKEFIKKYFSKGFYNYNILETKGSGHYYNIGNEVSLHKNIAIVMKPFSTEDGLLYKLGEYIDLDKFIISDQTLIENLSLTKTINIFSNYLTNYIEKNMPEVILWEYDPKYLLPGRLELESFVVNPSTNQSLKNLFYLAGYFDINKSFKEAMDEDGDYANLLETVSTIATKEFTKKWPDLKGIHFEITKDGTELITKVKEKVKYNFEDRSDGFKQFISILLTLSAQVDTGMIKNAIILIDEPDRSLYPTGARYLKDELIKLSENNLVIYSTHSPFMIDNEIVDRHLIVEKRDDITTTKNVDNSTFKDDEVLLNAIGTTSCEFIKEKNLVFEGWGDNRLFKIALQSKKQDYASIIKFFNDFGIAFSTGCKDIKSITPIIMLSTKDVFIFTDSDDASNNAKKYYIEDHGYKCDQWFTFQDLGGSIDETLEDYVDIKLLKKALEHIPKDIDMSTRTIPVMKFLNNKLETEEKKEFKRFVSNNLEPKYVSNSYYEVLKKLKLKIEQAGDPTVDE